MKTASRQSNLNLRFNGIPARNEIFLGITTLSRFWLFRGEGNGGAVNTDEKVQMLEKSDSNIAFQCDYM